MENAKGEEKKAYCSGGEKIYLNAFKKKVKDIFATSPKLRGVPAIGLMLKVIPCP